MAKSKRVRKLSWPIRVLALFAVAVLAVVAIASYPGGTSPGFQEYKPTSLPAGLKVTGSDLFVLRDPKFIPSFSKHINLNFNLANSWIEENKTDGQSFFDTWCKNYQQGSSCQQYTTPKNQKYLLSTYTTNSAGELGQEVYFIKGSTSIQIVLTNYQRITQAGWGGIIDSFQPAHYDHPQIIRGSTHGP